MALEVKETSGKLFAPGNYSTSIPTVSGKLALTNEFTAGVKGEQRPGKSSALFRERRASAGKRFARSPSGRKIIN